MTEDLSDPRPLSEEEIRTLREMAQYYKHRAWLWDIAVRWGKAGLIVATGAVALKGLFGDYFHMFWKALLLR